MRSTVAGARWQGAAGFARKAGEIGHVGFSIPTDETTHVVLDFAI